ncbi:ABC transporter permease [Actinosynnema sp. CS-041913]|uniref:ABC transporter permease n=1 Tax=Actinosynnema sp. CS-041913 TaxID=3239917 RepID=UPI003D8E2B2E
MTVTSTPVAQRAKVGWGDLLWLTWRQHRWQLGGVALAVGGVTLACLVIAWVTDATGTYQHDFLFLGGFNGASQLASIASIAFGGLIAVFWAAPLLSREYEQKTSVVVWTQDITPTRWLVGKMVLLGVPAVGLAAALGSAVRTGQNAMNSAREDYFPYRPFESAVFESAPLLQIGYAAFGFALGLAVSAITRRTVLSMGLTLGLFIAVRMAVGVVWRPYFQTPLRRIQPYDSPRGFGGPRVPDDLTMYVASGYMDAAGNEIEFPRVCGTRSYDTADGFVDCLRGHGVVNTFTDYQPVERLVPFQLFEFAVFGLLAAGLLTLTHLWVRRSHRF